MAFTGHVLKGSRDEDALQILAGKLEATTAQGRPRRAGLYLEFSVRGCNGRAGGSRERKPPSGVQGQGRGGGLGALPQEAIGTMKYCAYRNWFLCIICLYVIAKTYIETVQLCNQTGSDDYFRDDVPC